MQVGANISVRKEVGDKSTKINEPREDPRISKEIHGDVNARRPLNLYGGGCKNPNISTNIHGGGAKIYV